MSEKYVRVDDHWWCSEHLQVHVGPITTWTMEHRKVLHPVYYNDRDGPRLDTTPSARRAIR